MSNFEDNETNREIHYRRIVAASQRYPWAILQEKLSEIQTVLETRSRGEFVSDAQVAAAIGSRKEIGAIKRQSSIAVVSMYGTIVQRANIFTQSSGGVSTEQFGAVMEELVADDEISAIVIDVDSPGGNTAGVPELAAKIMAMRSQKKIVAVANSMMASAAYWIATAASELVAAPSALIGSIGVLAMHVDNSKALEEDGKKVTLISAGKHKTDGNPYEPLSDQAREGMQSLVDSYYDLFVSAVAQQRGVNVDQVKSGFGQGRVVLAAEAMRLGMVDRVETMEQTLQRLSAETGGLGLLRPSGNRVALLEREVEALNY
jgi:signal peptide peptidase SppA